jgi:hypothetical protein
MLLLLSCTTELLSLGRLARLLCRLSHFRYFYKTDAVALAGAWAPAPALCKDEGQWGWPFTGRAAAVAETASAHCQMTLI